MKKIYCLVAAMAFAMGAMAQSLVIENSLMKIDNSSAIVLYNNYFASLNNPDLDEPFPYAVIRMDLLGEAKDIKAAKEKLLLNLGTMQKVEQTIKSEQNKIIFLVPRSARNIELMCGDGCESQTLWNGTLHANAVYVCQVRYTAPAADASNQELASMMAQMNATLQQMQNGGTTQTASNQKPATTSVAKPQKTKPVKKTLPEGVGIVMNSKADMKYLGKKQYTLNGTTDMDNKEIAKFYQQNSPEAYKKYMSGKNCKIGGWVSFGVGLAAVAGGTVVLALMDNANNGTDYSNLDNWNMEYGSKGGYDCLYYTVQIDNKEYTYVPSSGKYYIVDYSQGTNPDPYYESTVNPLVKEADSWMEPVGASLLAVGATLTVASIPLLSVGYSKCKNAYKTYNKQLLDSYTFSGNDYYKYQQRPIAPLQLSMKVAPLGLGLSLKF